jgi:hypothetical protein
VTRRNTTAMMISVLSRQDPDGMTTVHPRAAGSLHGGWRGVGQEPRSGAVPWVENQSSPGLLPMAVAAALTRDQDGKEGGSSLFILRERSGSRVWEW